jgi:hypothetical protein
MSELSQRSSASTPTIPSTVDWAKLSDEAAWIVTHLLLPLRCGLSRPEVAGQVGETSGWVTKRLKELRVELEQLALSPVNAARHIEESLKRGEEVSPDAIEELVQQFDAAAEALAKYGDHGPDCLSLDNPAHSCNCGYSAALKQAGLL